MFWCNLLLFLTCDFALLFSHCPAFEITFHMPTFWKNCFAGCTSLGCAWQNTQRNRVSIFWEFVSALALTSEGTCLLKRFLRVDQLEFFHPWFVHHHITEPTNSILNLVEAEGKKNSDITKTVLFQRIPMLVQCLWHEMFLTFLINEDKDVTFNAVKQPVMAAALDCVEKSKELKEMREDKFAVDNVVKLLIALHLQFLTESVLK